MTGRRGIVGAGNWILDTVKTIDRWPPEGELAQILSVDRAGGGGPCNVLFDLAALTCGKRASLDSDRFELGIIKKRLGLTVRGCAFYL